MGDLSALNSRAVVGMFLERFEAQTPFGRRISNIWQSDQATETIVWTGHAPPMRKWEGSRELKQMRTESKTITNFDYEATIVVKAADLRRFNGAIVREKIDELAMSAAAHYDELVETIIGANTSYTCRDGQYLFDTDHSTGSSGTQVNACTSSHIACLDITTATAPTVQEAADGLFGLIGYMKAFKNDHGKAYVNRAATNFIVVCPTVAIYASMQRAVTERYFAAGADNPIWHTPFTIEVIHSAALAANTTKFWVFREDTESKAFVITEDKPLEINVLDETSEHYIMNKELVFGVSASRGIEPYNWTACAQATFS